MLIEEIVKDDQLSRENGEIVERPPFRRFLVQVMRNESINDASEEEGEGVPRIGSVATGLLVQ